MSEASLAVQTLIFEKLSQNVAVTSLVPVDAIFDRNERPETFPCILLGEAQTVGENIDCIEASDVYSTIHVWTKEDNFAACKAIAGAIRRALRSADGTLLGFRIVDTSFEDARFLRDPSGEHSHGVVTLISQTEEI